MMDLQALTARLELATGFQERQQLARDTAAAAEIEELGQIARLLGHDAETVRLGAIEILAAARFRQALRHLAAFTVQKDGEERAFAARAIAHMAEPGDRKLLEPVARAWLKRDDPFLHIHAESVLEKLGIAREAKAAVVAGEAAERRELAVAGPAGSESPEVPIFGITSPERDIRERAIARTVAQAANPERVLLQGLFESGHSGVRVDLITALEGLGPERMASVASQVLRRGDGDSIVLFVRALRRHTGELPHERMDEIRASLRQAYWRVGDEYGRSVVDECLVAIQPSDELEALIKRADKIGSEAAYRLGLRLAKLDDETRLEYLNSLYPALARAPRRILLFAKVLRGAWPRLRPRRRDELAGHLREAAARKLPSGLPAGALVDIARLYLAAHERGDRPPESVLEALDKHHVAETALVAIELYAAAATEEAAHRIAEYLEDGDAAVREAAREALAELTAPVAISFADDGSVTIKPDYQSPEGEPLRAGKGVLEAADGTRYALGRDGEPVRENDTTWGGCRCCDRPRVLERRRGKRPCCPVTGDTHLVVDGRPALEREHDLGGCAACESLAPLVRHGGVVRCPACDAEHSLYEGVYVKARRQRSDKQAMVPALPKEAAKGSEPPGPLRRDELPKPPSPGDLQLVEPAIARAMAANVFLVGDAAETRWAGSGVIVARDDDEVAILTGRHVVEDEIDGRVSPARIHIYAISGELVAARIVWRAAKGLDLALVTARLTKPDRVVVMDLDEGSCLVGSELFTIGNPMGLSWSYSSGALAAFRDWKTAGDLDVRFIQSNVTMARGSSGGGLYHKSGHLVGINSFGRGESIGPGGDQNFSIAMPSVLAALRREAVTFAGKPLVGD